MKSILSSTLRRAALCLPALGLMLAPLASQAKDNEKAPDSSNVPSTTDSQGGRAGAIDEFNFGPTGMDVIKQRENPADDEGNRKLSGRVVEMKGRTLYVEREGAVVPLDLSALRITKQPRPGQEIVATYSVDETRNIAMSLAGEVAEGQ